MNVIKYPWLNIKANKKLYFSVFIISVLMLFLLISTSTIREQIMEARTSDLRFNEYAAVAIRAISPTQIIDNDANITDEFIGRYSGSEYVIKYYAFTQLPVGSSSLYPVPQTAETPWRRVMHSPMLDIFERQFTLIIYSDIHMSTHFILGDRTLAQGRFAENTTEVMISVELANENNLIIGDFVEVYFSHLSPGSMTFEIVGIFYDYLSEFGNELELMLPRTFEIIHNPMPGADMQLRVEKASNYNLSRNQILTAAQSSAEQTCLRRRGVFGGQANPYLMRDFGYDVVVFYVYDEQSIIDFISSIEDTLHAHHFIFDSGDMMRFVGHSLGQTQRTFTLALTGILIVGAVIYILAVLYILKLRTYDIGVFRTLGLSRIYTTILLTLEFFIISLIAFAMAAIAYFATFSAIADVVYRFQYQRSDADFLGFVSLQQLQPPQAGVYDFINRERILEGTQDFVFAPEVTMLQLFIGFLVVMFFTVVVGIAVSLFIVRNEPIKTMKEF